MHLAIYDISLEGHRSSYLHAIATESVRRNWKTTVLLPSTAQSHPFAKSLLNDVGSQNVIFSAHSAPTLVQHTTIALAKYHLLQHRAAAKSIQSLTSNCNFVYFPTLDHLDKGIQVFGSPTKSIPMGGMCMRTRFHMKSLGIEAKIPARASLIGSLGFRKLLRTRGIKCITTADPSLAQYSSLQKAHEFSKVRYIPEIGMEKPTINEAAGKRWWGFEPDDCVVLVYGALSKRKGIPDLVKAFHRLQNPRIRALIVGEPDKDCQTLLESPDLRRLIDAGRIKVSATFCDRASEAAAFAAANAVWVAYTGHDTMSGVFLQAVCSEIPVITGKSGILPWLASRDGVGISVDPGNHDRTAAQISELLTDPIRYQTYCDNAKKIAEEHRPANFARVTCDSILDSLRPRQADARRTSLISKKGPQKT